MKKKQNDIEEPLTSQPDTTEVVIADLLLECFKPGKKVLFDYSHSTLYVFNKLQKIYPSSLYTAHDVYVALKELGYVYENIGGEWEWLFML
jgi:hypothetical protein